MPSVHIDARVRLKEEVPAYSLQRGVEGTVVSVWLSYGGFRYEVEFRGRSESQAVRLLLSIEQLEVVE